MMFLTDLAAVCRNAGLTVVEVPGWKTRGAPDSAGRPRGMSGVRSIACHHTAGAATGDAPSLNYVRDRNLSQIVLGRTGTVYVVAAGRCHHAGVVHEDWMGNSWSIGIEAEHTGSPSVAWPAVQYAAYVRLARALANHYVVPYARVLGHKEIAAPTGRKTDPTFDMRAFRTALNAKEDDMTPEQAGQLKELLDRVRNLDRQTTGADDFAAKVGPSIAHRLIDVQDALTAALPILRDAAAKPDADPEVIAAAVAGAIPQGMARSVVDELNRRLAQEAAPAQETPQ